MLKWYLLFSVMDFGWVFMVFAVILTAVYGILWLVLACSRGMNCDGYSIFNAKDRERNAETAKAYTYFLMLKKIRWIVLLIVLWVLALVWPTEERLIKSYALNEVMVYLQKTPDAALNPQNLLDLVSQVLGVVETGVTKLLGLMK